MTLLAATSARVAAIDTVFLNIRDLEGLRAEALAARRDGFTGKIALDPAQVGVINDVFRIAIHDAGERASGVAPSVRFRCLLTESRTCAP